MNRLFWGRRDCAVVILGVSFLGCSLLGCAGEKPEDAEVAPSSASSPPAPVDAGRGPLADSGALSSEEPKAAHDAETASIFIEWHPSADAQDRSFFEVTGLARQEWDESAGLDGQTDALRERFAVYVAGRGERLKDQPALLGSYEADDRGLRFYPRFPLEPGLSYRAVFSPGSSDERPEDEPDGRQANATPIIAEFNLPALPKHATTVVEHVYPSADPLPENQLKFYLHFSAPMSRGEAYQRIHLLDASGEEIEGAFLELGEELWDPEGRRFTLFIDPGRIKRGLKPREDLGPVLEQGRSYTLVIDAEWPDAAGNRLVEPFRKTFHVEAPDEAPIDIASWEVKSSPVATREPLVVTFPEPLDHAMLQRVLDVIDAHGKKVQGTVEVADDETVWRFTPDSPWKAGPYEIVVATNLEDLAGNSIGRPFEVDVFREVQKRVERETVKLPFEVASNLSAPDDKNPSRER